MRQFLTLVAFSLSTVAFGQPGVTIEVVGARPVEASYRIAGSPQIIDTLIPTPLVEYPLLPLKYETKTELERINPASIKTTENLEQLYNTYVKLGVGTELMPLGEVYFDANRSRKFVYGAHLKHLSSFGNLPDFAPAQFDRTKLDLYGGINEKKYSVGGNFHYGSQGLHYYGISDTLGLTRDSIAQRYNDIGFGGFFSSHKKDSANVNFKIGIDYNNYASRKPLDQDREDWRARENYFAFKTGAWYKLGKEVYAADFNVRYNGYKYGVLDSSYTNPLDTGIVLNNTIINLRPTITTQLKNNRFKAKIGLDLVVNIHDKSSAHIYPIAELKYSLFNDIFIPYVGLRGEMKQTSFKSLTGRNEFLLSNVNMLNENKAIDFYGGIKGTLSKRISFNAGISFARVKNLPLFVTDTTYSLGNKFNVLFDTATVTTIDGSISYQMKEKLKIDAIAKFNSYSLLNNSYAWNLPNLQVILRGTYNLFDKFIFTADLDIEQGRRALVYGPGEDVVVEDNQFVKTLNFITDVNLSAEYRYNKRISAFVQFNNIASQRYMRWYNTPVQSLQVLGGVTFKF